MNIPPLWIAILVACVLAVPLLLRMAGLRAKAVVPRKRLAFDEKTEAAEPVPEPHLFRLGRLSLTESGADRARR